MKKIAFVSMLVLGLSAFTNATFAAKPGFYLGAGVGASQLETPKTLQNPTASLLTTQVTKKGFAIPSRLFTGYTFNDYFGVEAGVARYQTSIYKGHTPANAYTASLNNALSAIDFVGKGYLPISDTGFNLYALGGVAYVVNKVDFKSTTAGITTTNGSQTTKKLRPIYGIGASYDIPQSNFSTNLELTRIQGVGNVKASRAALNSNAIPSADMVSLNLAYNFN